MRLPILRLWVARYFGKPPPLPLPFSATIAGWLLWGIYWDVAASAQVRVLCSCAAFHLAFALINIRTPYVCGENSGGAQTTRTSALL